MINTKMNNGAILPRMLDGIVQLLGVKVSVTMLVIMSKKYDDSLQFVVHTHPWPKYLLM